MSTYHRSSVYYPQTQMYTTQPSSTYMPEYDSYPTGRYSYDVPTSYGGARSSATGPLKVVWEIVKFGVDIATGLAGF